MKITLPTVMRKVDLNALRKLGFRFTDPNGGLHFETEENREACGGSSGQEVILPSGWKLVEDEKISYARFLEDGLGRTRGRILYSKHSSCPGLLLYGRYQCGEKFHSNGLSVFMIIDRVTSDAVFIGALPFPPVMSLNGEAAELKEKAFVATMEWAALHFPRWDDPTAYWDD